MNAWGGEGAGQWATETLPNAFEFSAFNCDSAASAASMEMEEIMRETLEFNPEALLSPSSSSSASSPFSSPLDANMFGGQFFAQDSFAHCFASSELPQGEPGFDVFSPPSSTVSSPLGECDSTEEVGFAVPYAQPSYLSSASSASSCSSLSDGKDGKAKKKRRRRRKADEEPHVPTALTLEREKLLKMSLSSFDNFVHTISEVRKLTAEELRDVKRQRRLIKNRESAQASRTRRKTEVNQMERQIEELQRDREGLAERVKLLEQQNNELQRMLASVGHHVQSAASSVWDSLSVNGSPRSASKAAGACLMIVLLSFGLFLNFGAAPPPASSPAVPHMRYMYEPSRGNRVSAQPRALAQPGGMRLLEVGASPGEEALEDELLTSFASKRRGTPVLDEEGPTVSYRAQSQAQANGTMWVTCTEMEPEETVNPAMSGGDVIMALIENKSGVEETRRLMCLMSNEEEMQYQATPLHAVASSSIAFPSAA